MNQVTKQNNQATNYGGNTISNKNSFDIQANQEVARIQGQIIIAKQFPRDIFEIEEQVKRTCTRQSLAEVAEYSYPRGGTSITGASIKLVEVIAQLYGNIDSGFKEIERTDKISKVYCWAWDLQTNTKTQLEFTVPLVRTTKKGTYPLTDERDIYEAIANQASRRLRKCLETIVSRDLIDLAREECQKTLSNPKADWQGNLNKAITWLEENHKVTLEQIEKVFGCKKSGFNPNTLVKLRNLCNSIKDGFVTAQDIFFEETKSKTKEELKEAQQETNATEEFPQQPTQDFNNYVADPVEEQTELFDKVD